MSAELRFTFPFLICAHLSFSQTFEDDSVKVIVWFFLLFFISTTDDAEDVEENELEREREDDEDRVRFDGFRFFSILKKRFLSKEQMLLVF